MKSFSNRVVPQLATYTECTGCFACVETCPKNAIETYINEEGHYAIKVDTEKCVHCGKCERVCNASRLNYGCNDLSLSTVYAGYTTDEALRRNATSGGVFAALAKTIIGDGGVVAGASFDGTYAKHILIDRVEDIEKLQGSKYTPSSMEGIYEDIEGELPYRKVLFSGTGCQVAGILAYFDKNPYINNLLTVDLVCGGVPSTELIRKFNEHYNCKIKSFRNKDKYELLVETSEGECKVIPRKNLPLDGFVYEMTNRLSCYDCKFAFCHRKSDITIGDLWDYTILPNEHKNGLSSIIVHNARSRMFLFSSKVELSEIPWKNVLKSNMRISIGSKKVYSRRRQLKENIAKLSYDDFERIYFQSPKKKDLLQIAFKIYRIFTYRIKQHNMKLEQIRILNKKEL